MNDEKHRLDSIAADSRYATGINSDSVRYSFRIFERHLAGDSILEMGAAEGVMTALLATTGKSLTIVEGSQAFCDSLRRRFPQASVAHSLFEAFEPGRCFDNIVLGHVLEHVFDPVATLRRAATWLVPNGRVLAAVPNSHSLHRQAAVLMEMLEREDELNEMDLLHGHRRVFHPATFARCFADAGLAVVASGGYWLKPLSNRQLEASWSPQMIDAFMQLGERFPDIAAEIYIVATLDDR